MDTEGINLTVCSICLRVLDGSEWIEPDELIRRMRTFERDAVPRLEAALCNRCSNVIQIRRGGAEEALAA